MMTKPKWNRITALFKKTPKPQQGLNEGGEQPQQIEGKGGDMPLELSEGESDGGSKQTDNSIKSQIIMLIVGAVLGTISALAVPYIQNNWNKPTELEMQKEKNRELVHNLACHIQEGFTFHQDSACVVKFSECVESLIKCHDKLISYEGKGKNDYEKLIYKKEFLLLRNSYDTTALNTLNLIIELFEIHNSLSPIFCADKSFLLQLIDKNIRGRMTTDTTINKRFISKIDYCICASDEEKKNLVKELDRVYDTLNASLYYYMDISSFYYMINEIEEECGLK